MARNYKVTCDLCKGSSEIEIDYKQTLKNTFIGEMPSITWRKIGTIISGRFRMDGEFGWQCMCGNNNLMTIQENSYINDPASPDPKEIESLKKVLVAEPSQLFNLVSV